MPGLKLLAPASIRHSAVLAESALSCAGCRVFLTADATAINLTSNIGARCLHESQGRLLVIYTGMIIMLSGALVLAYLS